jgi:hypothetical protein
VKSLSADYEKRRAQLLRARLVLAIWIPLSIACLLGLSLVEVWAVRRLLTEVMSYWPLVMFVGAIFVTLGVSCFGMARVSLLMTYHMEHAGWARTAVVGTFLGVYVFAFFQLPNPQLLLPLAVGKLFSILLNFRFWKGQIFHARLSRNYGFLPRDFLTNPKAFWMCRWILIASYLLCLLGFALALVSVHPVIEMDGWEGVMLSLSFFLLFRVFAGLPQSPLQENER